MRGLLPLLFVAARVAGRSLPVKKIYGVNIGNWLVMEPWMMRDEWASMGGEECADCSQCIGSESALAKTLGNETDSVFQKHWETWFNQADIDRIKAAGLNTVRIPLGYWLVEPLVDRSTEYYGRGGLTILKTRLRAMKAAGLHVILDHHALPGAAAIRQQFAGLCTSEPQFYTQKNYDRALVWAAVMTAFIYLDVDFANVFSLQAINEPVQDWNKTPGLGQYEKDFVQTVRAIEKSIGISKLPSGIKGNLTVSNTILAIANLSSTSAGVRRALRTAQPMLVTLIYAHGARVTKIYNKRTPLWTNFMDVSWQRSGAPNPADAKDAYGPQSYDNHIYYNFGGVTTHSESAYMKHLCNLDRLAKATSVRNTPLWFGEWSLATGFNASDAFLKKWADAQKTMYAASSGWIFWSFKIGEGQAEQKQWDYFEALRRGYFTKSPSAVWDKNVCNAYKNE
ncbi:glycoside hydrolase family 5 protein [Auricularia subglabra TFB-10046 SS5]|nr:glycoside hydrolase family 5 protein [Auricularia subglabra TFB-10046 SS5]